MSSDSSKYRNEVDNVNGGMAIGDNTVINNYNCVAASRTCVRSESPRLENHDGCWRLRIAIQKGKHVEGGNNREDDAFFFDPELVQPDASKREPLLKLVQAKGQLPPSGQPMKFDEKKIKTVLREYFETALRIVNEADLSNKFHEIIVIVSLDNELITDWKWIKLLRDVKKEGNKDSPPVAIECLTLRPSSHDNKPKQIGTTPNEYSKEIAEITSRGARLRELTWLLIESEPNEKIDEAANSLGTSNVIGHPIASRKTFQQLDQMCPENFFENHHALWLRWPVTASGKFAFFKKRLDKILHSGIPFFFLESAPAAADSAGSATHLLDWCCDEFVKSYCKIHRRPMSSPSNEIERNKCLRYACLYWDDHRYKPFKPIQPAAADLFASPLNQP